MRKNTRKCQSKRRSRIFLSATLFLAFSTYVNQVVAYKSDASINEWPSMPRRNIAALAREGYLRSSFNGLKRSISTLAKNGQLPTFRSPYDETDKQEQDEEETPDKRNLASIARLRSYSTIKRNIQALARDGHKFGRVQYNQQNDKRNIAALARDGMIHKKNDFNGEEYYYPFYQNPLPPLSEVDGPYDYNEIYDLQQSINPDMLPPLSRMLKRSDVGIFPNMFVPNQMNNDGNWNLKRGSVGLPVLGIYRPLYTDSNNRNKRSIYSIPDVMDKNDIADNNNEDYEIDSDDKRSVDDDSEVQNFAKRHIGSLARYGLLPTFRYSGGRYSRSGRARLLFPSQDYLPPYSSEAAGSLSDCTATSADLHGDLGGQALLPLRTKLATSYTQCIPAPTPFKLKHNSHELHHNRIRCGGDAAPGELWKYSSDENVQAREYISNYEDDSAIDANDNTFIPPPAIPAHPHPTGRYFHRAISNELPPSNTPRIPPPLTLSNFEAMTRNRWQSPKEPTTFYYFRSLKVPHHTSGKRYLRVQPEDKAISKNYRNSSLPSRRKNL